MKRLIALGMVAVLGGCGDDSGPGVDSGRMDTGGSDSGGTDSGGTDSGGVDSGGMDSGGMDAGGMDAAPGDCDDVTCDTNATCDDSGGSPVCTCNMGFMGDGFTCTDVDECTTMPTVCGMGTCMNMPGSYTCTCNMGYSFDGTTCTNVNECTMTPTICGVGTCMDTDGAYTCTCPMGYTFSGGTCTDIDECAATPTICGVGTCMDTDGSYTCTCPGGYEFTGGTCANIDECTRGTDTCLAVATCTDTPGSFTCACPAGFTGDGITACTDIDECATGAASCTASQACVNTVGSFMCRCLFGRSGPTCTLPTILLYDDDPTEFHADVAATGLGYTVNRTTSRAAFQAAFDAGGYAMVIYDAPGFGLDAGDESRLRTYISGGGRVIFGAYNLNGFPLMQATLGVTVVSYGTPRPIHRATTALVDLYTQANAINTPMVTSRDAGDNGDELTLVGGVGQIVARLDSGAGPGAMAITNSRRVIINGFLPWDVGTSDSDADGTLDIVEMYRNQINYILNPTVLLYTDLAMDYSTSAARRMNWTSITTMSGPTFATPFDAGLGDVVVVDAPNVGLPMEVTTRVTTHIGAGRRVIFSWWQLNSDPALQTTLGVSVVTFGMPRPIHRSPGTAADFYSLVSTFRFPSPLTTTRDAGDNGDELTPAAGGFVAARFDSPTGPGAIAVTRANRVIVNGFLPFDVNTTDNDTDMIRDMEEMYGNELHYLFLP